MYQRFRMRPDAPAICTTLSAILLGISMTFSPFLLSVGIWALVAAALWQAAISCKAEQPEQSGIGNILLYSVKKVWRSKVHLGFMLLFVVVAISGLWSDDLNYWLERTRIRIPFIVLPWAFANLPKLSGTQLRLVPYAVLWSIVILSLGVALNFMLDPETVLAGLHDGQPVPVPRHHIRFSLMVVVAIISGGWLWRTKFWWQHPREQYVLGLAVALLFIFIHILSVRSGLVALYAALFYSILRYISRNGNWRRGLAALGILALVPIVAISTVPSLQQRLSYMLHDWQKYKSAEGGESYSDSERFVSLHVGLDIWQQHPLLGAGMGDLPAASQISTDRLYPSYNETPKMPHNQFIYLLAGTGLLGMLLSIFPLLYPLWQKRYQRFYLFSAFQVIIFVSFLVEYTLETSIGAAFYLFYTLWWMKMADDEPEYK